MDMEFRALGVALAGAMVVSACGAAERGAEPAGGVTTRPLPHAPASDPRSSEIQTALPASSKVLASSLGDVNADGRPDAVVALETGGAASVDVQASRVLMILLRNAAGVLEPVVENHRIVPCAACGGSLGEPSIYVDAGSGSFLLRAEGGTGWLWSNEYLFAHHDGRWLLQSVTRTQHHRASHETNSTTLLADDFGQIDFKDFDPGAVEAVRGE